MLVILCAVILSVVLFLLALQYMKVCKLSTKELFAILTIVVIMCMFLVYFVDPPEGWDLYRHYEDIRSIANSRKWTGSYKGNYQTLPVAALLFTVVSYLPSAHYLQVISIAVSGFIILYVLKDYNKTVNVQDDWWILVAFFCSVAYLNIVMCISGIRNTMAAAISSLGIYLGIRKEKRVVGLALCFVAAGIHPQAVIILILYLTNRILFKLNNKMHWFALLVWPITIQISTLFENTGNSYIQYVFDLLSIYRKDEAQVDMRIVVVQSIAVVCFLWSVWKAERKEEFKDNPGPEYFSMLKIYLFAVLGSLGNNLLFYRMLYPIGILMVPQIACMVAGENNKSKQTRNGVLLTVLWGGLILYNAYEIYGALK